jgi:hypothetical protein
VLLVFVGTMLMPTRRLIKAKLNIGMDVADAKNSRFGFSITCDDVEKVT